MTIQIHVWRYHDNALKALRQSGWTQLDDVSWHHVGRKLVGVLRYNDADNAWELVQA